MTQATLEQSELSERTRTYEVGAYTGSQTRSEMKIECQVYSLGSFYAPDEIPKDVRCITEVVSDSEKKANRLDYLKKARAKLGASLGQSGPTISSMRLQHGWSQTKFAEMLGTSQSHVARIERGTENVSIQTCRKLAQALGIDMNALDEALRRQEEKASAKVSDQ